MIRADLAYIICCSSNQNKSEIEKHMLNTQNW